MNAKDKRKARKSPVRPKKILKPSSTSDLEPTTAEDDFPAMKDWYLSLGFESIIDSAGATEEKLATHCPVNLRRHLTLFHRMAKMASRDILERRATLDVRTRRRHLSTQMSTRSTPTTSSARPSTTEEAAFLSKKTARASNIIDVTSVTRTARCAAGGSIIGSVALSTVPSTRTSTRRTRRVEALPATTTPTEQSSYANS